MKTLIVEDESTSRKILETHLSPLGPTDMVENGKVAIQALTTAWEAGEPYDLVCLDIHMPEMDGKEALKTLREEEEKRGIKAIEGAKVIMVTADDLSETILGSFRDGCDYYLVKPIEKDSLFQLLKKAKLV